MTPYLIEVYKQGGNLGAFKSVYKEFEKAGMLKSADKIALDEQCCENLPWNFIEYSRDCMFLKSEYERLLTLS